MYNTANVNKEKRRRMRRVISFAAVLAVLAVTVLATSGAPRVYAQSTGLAITPRYDVNIDAGNEQSGTLYVSNLNKNVPLKARLMVIDFQSKGETGTPALNLDETANPTPWSLRPFLSLPETITVDPGAEQYVPFTIKIPANQGAGTYYSAIRYVSENEANGGNVAISASGATLMFITVPGRATELMHLKKFGAYNLKDDQEIGKYQSLFVSQQPKRLAFHAENVGNVAENPRGSVIIKNIFGKTVKTIDNINPKNNLALIQERRFDICLNPKDKEVNEDGRKTRIETCESIGLWPGMYTATLSAYYGINGSNTQEIATKATFWYLPAWSLAVIAVIIALIAFVVYKVRRSFKGAAKRHKRSK